MPLQHIPQRDGKYLPDCTASHTEDSDRTCAAFGHSSLPWRAAVVVVLLLIFLRDCTRLNVTHWLTFHPLKMSKSNVVTCKKKLNYVPLLVENIITSFIKEKVSLRMP